MHHAVSHGVNGAKVHVLIQPIEQKSHGGRRTGNGHWAGGGRLFAMGYDERGAGQTNAGEVAIQAPLGRSARAVYREFDARRAAIEGQ